MFVKCAHQTKSKDLKKNICKVTKKECIVEWQLCSHFKSAYPFFRYK